MTSCQFFFTDFQTKGDKKSVAKLFFFFACKTSFYLSSDAARKSTNLSQTAPKNVLLFVRENPKTSEREEKKDTQTDRRRYFSGDHRFPRTTHLITSINVKVTLRRPFKLLGIYIYSSVVQFHLSFNSLLLLQICLDYDLVYREWIKQLN